MLTKPEIEKFILEDLKKILLNKPIYKYADFDTGIDNILLEKTLKFSHPSIFNDPFDCNEKLLKVVTPKIELQRLFEQVKLKVPVEFHKELWKNMNDPEKVEEFNKSEKDKSLISCFSELNDEVLMWSHYAEKHTGICIGFNFPHSYEDKFILCPIKYVPKLEPLDGECSLSRVILYWLTTKSERWTYEKEIRAITKSTLNTEYEILKYEEKFIKEVIFGCNVKNEKINETILKIKNSKLNIDNIQFKQMIIDNETFLLKERIIKTSAPLAHE